MGITKTEGFAAETTQMAEVLKALGHPARLEIIKFLAGTPSCICGDIVNELPLAQPTISRHLSELKKVGLIKGSISGSTVCYCINNEVWEQVKALVDELSQTLHINRKCC